MSEHITHTAVFEDAFYLMDKSNKICAIFKEIGKKHKQFANLGCIAMAADRHSVQLLTKLRENWPGNQEEEVQAERKLVYILGWLTHRAADRQMKPVFRQIEPDREYKPNHSSIYQDVFLFNQYYLQNDPFGFKKGILKGEIKKSPLADFIDIEQVTEFCQAIMTRSLISMHTFKPDDNDIENWLESLFNKAQTFHVDIERYAKAITNPDPGWIQKAIIDIDFYDDNDKILRAVHKIRLGEAFSANEVDEAYLANPQSHYGIAVKKAFSYIIAASEFFTSDMHPDELREKLDIGKKGWDGGSV